MRRDGLVLTAILAFASCAHAQGGVAPAQVTPTNDTGLKSYQTYSGAHENINLANGNLSLEIPLVSLPGRNGLNLNLAVQYNSKIWSPHATYSGSGDVTYRWQHETDGPPVGDLGWTFNTPAINSGSIIDDANGYPIGQTPFILTLPGGGKTSIEYASAAMDSQDGSFVTLSRGGGAATAYLKDGTQVHFPGEDSYADTISDTNNNYITFGSAITDTLGRQVTFATVGTYPSQTQTISYKDSNGAQQNVVLTLTGIALFQNTGSRPFQYPVPCTVFSCSKKVWVNQPGSGGYLMLTRIDLPGGRYYSFSYNDYGELTKITYPAGGYTRYDYTAYQHGETFWADAALNIASDFREVTAKWVCRDSSGLGGTCSQEDRTAYAPHVASPKLNNDSVDVDHYLTPTTYERTTHQFTNIDTQDSQPQYYSPRETMRSSYRADGTLLETVETQYNVDADLERKNLPSSVIATRYDVGPPLVKRTDTQYDTYSATVLWPWWMDYQNQTPQARTRYIDNPLQQTDFGWYPQGGTAAAMRISNTTWWKARWADHVWNRPFTQETQDGSGVRAAFEQFEYDNYTEGLNASGAIQRGFCSGPNCSNRGNQTAVSRWRNTDGAMLTTRNQFDDAGNVRKTTDPGGHSTLFSYNDSWADSTCPPPGTTAAYLTRITNALNQNTQMKYYACTGTLYSKQDQNDLNAGRPGTTYTYDLLNRVKTASYPDTGQETFDYHGDTLPLTVSTTQLATPNPSILGSTVYDGLARPVKTQLDSDPEGVDYTDTTYDALGRVYSVSNPYRATSDPTYGITYSSYDALGRSAQVTRQDGNTVTTSYSGNCITVTDETGRPKQSCSDALGRMTDVYEPNPSTGSLISGSFHTDYVYDALANLKTVTQYGDGSGPARVRSFTYDSLSCLLDSTNPETGLVCYGTMSGPTCNRDGYDADGNLIHRTDSRGITTSFGYDPLHRELWSSHSDGSPGHGYNYDLVNEWGLQISNPIGRLITENTAGQAPARLHQYDAMGRVNYQIDCLPSGACPTSTAQYDLAGHLTFLTYPSGRKVSENYNAAGRLLNVNFASFQGTPVNYTYFTAYQNSSDPGYNPTGALRVSYDGNNVWSAEQYNARLQPSSFLSQGSVPGTPYYISRIYSYNETGFGNRNGGNVATISDGLNGVHSQNYSYDYLNRIAAGNQNDGAFNQTFSPDAWGNLKQFGTAAFSPNFDANNRISQTGYTYDAAGNLLSDTLHNYAYDAESRIKSVDTTGATYTYDADGNRVRKDVGSDATEYIYFQGQPIAEYKPASGDWSDYIYANGKRIVKADSFDNAVEMQGSCSGGLCYTWHTVPDPGGLFPYTVQPGDKLYWRQYQGATTQGGVVLLYTDGGASAWSTYDQNHHLTNSSPVTGVWETRSFDLGQVSGHTISSLGLGMDENTTGSWDILFQDVALVSSDGTVRPLYTDQSAINLPPWGDYHTTVNIAVRHRSNVGSSTETTTTYYHEDQLGSSRLLTNSAGYPVWQGTFLPFGQEWNLQLTTNHYKFTGKERDAESGLDYFGARYYSSSMGRWLSADWSFAPTAIPYADLSNPQSLNLYSYVGNNPMNLVDPLGHFQLSALPKPIPPPRNPDGSIQTPPTVDNKGDPILPNGRNGEPNSWVVEPNSKPRNGAPRYQPKYRIPAPKDGGPPSPPNASWDERGHWDVNNGDGTRDRYTPDGQPVDHNNNPILPTLQVPIPPGLQPEWWRGTDAECGGHRCGSPDQPLVFPGLTPSSVPMAPSPVRVPFGPLDPVFVPF